MANIQERRDKSGKLISYSIRVFRGRGADGKQLKPFTATFDVSHTWTEKSARKKAEAFAATVEKQCKEGTATDTRQTFSSYCDYVIELKEQRGAKHSTIVRYRELAARICPAIGHIRLKDLRVDHLNTLYTELSKNGMRKGTAHAAAKMDLAGYLKANKLSRAEIARRSGPAASTVSASKRLGHAQVSTTANIYAHVMEEADQKNAEILSDIFLKKHRIFRQVELKLNFSLP